MFLSFPLLCYVCANVKSKLKSLKYLSEKFVFLSKQKGKHSLLTFNYIDMDTTEYKHHPVKRGFKSYFYEFFMLFLAVTAGFFVENMRENYVERQTEKQFIESLRRDLIIDTVSGNEIIQYLELKAKYIDTIISTLEKPNAPDYTAKVYRLASAHLSSITGFTSSDKTITQLKNSGGLRLIQKNGTADSIAGYYEHCNNVTFNTNFLLKQYDIIMTFDKKIIDFKALQGLVKPENLRLIIENENTMTYFYNEVVFYNSFILSYIQLIKETNIKAGRLLMFIEDTYRLETGIENNK